MATSPEIQEIKNKIDVADFIGEYLRLMPAGTGVFKALCPFHNEKTPSFMVSPSRGTWHCFGCGAGGDIFEFLMKIENLDFPEALRVLAQKAGVTLSRQNREVLSRKNRLYDLCDLTARYWHKVLMESPRAQEIREYLQKRGISEESIEIFRLGYAVDEWDNLYNFLIKKNFRPEEIFAAGLSIRKERGSGYYDRFRHRVMFPILDHHGRIIGFGGRALKKDEPAKYINSPQTEIYNKSEALYGLYWAKDEIRKKDLCILVEGYMDVIPSHQTGVKNVVSISGTALTEQQLKAIKRYTENLALSLDMDEAGQRAALRSVELALAAEMNVKVISLPQGKDPGECATNNPDLWHQAIASAQPVMEYFFSQATKNRDSNKPEDKKLIARNLILKVIQLGNPVERDHWLRQLASHLNVSEASIRELAVKAEQGRQNSSSGTRRPQTGLAQSPAVAATKPQDGFSTQNIITRDLLIFSRLLALIWVYPEFLFKLPEILSPEMVGSELAQGIYKDLILFYTKNNELFTLGAEERNEQQIFDQFISQVKNQAADQSATAILEQSFLLAQGDIISLEPKDAKIEFDTLLRLIKTDYFNSQIAELQSALRQAEMSGDRTAAEKIYRELSELIRQKAAL